MKIITKSSIFFVLSIVPYFLSCTNEKMNEIYASKQINITASDFEISNQSRAVLSPNTNSIQFAWGDNDTIGIFPNKGTQVAFPMINGSGSHTATFDGGGWLLKEATTYAAYYPYNHLNTSSQYLPISYRDQKQVGNNSTTHLGQYDLMISKVLSPVNNSINFEFTHLNSLIQLEIEVPFKGNLSYVKLVSDKVCITTDGYVNLYSDKPQIESKNQRKSITLETENIQTKIDNEMVTLYLMMPPTNFKGDPIDIRICNNGKTYSKRIPFNTLEGGKAYKYHVTFEENHEISKTIHIEVPGTLNQLISEKEKYKISKLTLIGNINGTDVRFIREMAGRFIGGSKTNGILKDLDLSDVTIVSGGNAFIKSGESFQASLMPDKSHITNTSTSQNVYTTANNGTFLFAGLNLERLILPNNLLQMGYSCCYGCQNLTTVTIPSSLRQDWFADNFEGCTSLTNFIIQNGHPNLKSKDGFIYDYLENRLVLAPLGVKVFQVPAFLDIIDNEAFPRGCQIETLHITNQKFNNEFFYNNILCLKNYIVDSSNPYYTALNGVLYSKDTIRIIKYPSNRDEKTFVIPSQIKIIGANCFYNSLHLENIQIQEGVEILENQCFGFIPAIKSITLPSTIKEIGYGALGMLKEVIVKSQTPPTINERITWHDDCKIYVPDEVVDLYLTANGWNAYTNQIFPMSQRPIQK